MLFVNSSGPDVEINDPSTVNFNVLPAPVFFEVVYKLLYRKLRAGSLFPHIDFDLFNKKLLVWLVERYNVRIEINRFFDTVCQFIYFL